METVEDASERTTYRFRLRPGDRGDRTAAFLRATIVLHKGTRTIESIALGSTGPFSPTLGVRIESMRTVMTYSLPNGDAPSLPLKVATHVRGTAFWLKSLDADMTVTFADYVNARKK